MSRLLYASIITLVAGTATSYADIVTFTTNAQATIYDGTPRGDGPFGFRDGIPDYFDFDRTPTGVLNAFWGGATTWEIRASMEFDIRSLAGIALDSAVLQLPEAGSGGAVNLSGYVGDGVLTLQDWTRLDTFITLVTGGSLPSTTISLDVSSYLQAAVDSGESFVGFTIWGDSVNHGGRTFDGASLLLEASVDLVVPLPLASPDPSFGNPVPAPGAAMLGMIGLGMVGWVRRRF